MRKTSTLLVLLFVGAAMAHAGDITFDVDLTPIGAGSVIGTITTDGTPGTLTPSDVLDWNLTLNDGATTFELLGPLSGNNSGLEAVGSDLNETATQLFFDFSDTAGTGYYLFQNPAPGSGMNFLCIDDGGCSNEGKEVLATAGPDQYSAVMDVNTVIGTAETAPEPGTLGLLAFGACALWWSRRFRPHSLRID